MPLEPCRVAPGPAHTTDAVWALTVPKSPLIQSQPNGPSCLAPSCIFDDPPP